MRDRPLKRVPGAESDPAGRDLSEGESPLDAVLKHSIAPSPERRLGRLQEVARRQERQRTMLQGDPRMGFSPSMEQRQASREHLNQEVRTHYRQQYGMARRTFDRLQQEILRDGRYLQNPAFVAEYTYWNAYFQSATTMDGQTFQRFTFWHTRFTQQARGVARVSSYAARRPDWRTLNEMLRVCELTSTVNGAHAGDRAVVVSERTQERVLSIGVGVLRSRRPAARRLFRLSAWIATRILGLLQPGRPFGVIRGA